MYVMFSPADIVMAGPNQMDSLAFYVPLAKRSPSYTVVNCLVDST